MKEKPEDTLLLNDIALRGMVVPEDRTRLKEIIEAHTAQKVREALEEVKARNKAEIEDCLKIYDSLGHMTAIMTSRLEDLPKDEAIRANDRLAKGAHYRTMIAMLEAINKYIDQILAHYTGKEDNE